MKKIWYGCFVLLGIGCNDDASSSMDGSDAIGEIGPAGMMSGRTPINRLSDAGVNGQGPDLSILTDTPAGGMFAGGGGQVGSMAGSDTSTLDSSDAGLVLNRPAAGGEGVMGTGVFEGEDTSRLDRMLCPPEQIVSPQCSAPIDNEAQNRLCDGFDNDCDGRIDEGCICKPGEVQPCFLGPPGRVNTGGCRPGTQRCVTENGRKVWGQCEGAQGPTTEICDGLDNDCNGCTDELFGCNPDGRCPAPGDPRIPPAAPFRDYPLNGRDFYAGEALSWSWTVEGGPCDEILPNQTSFDLLGTELQNAIFRPKLSGSYRVTLTVTTPEGPFQCTWIVDVTGPGLRVEMCYPESETQDLDLFLMRADVGPNGALDGQPWYPNANATYTPNPQVCSWSNCEAMLRMSPSRVDWGYQNSMLDACEGGPQGNQWRALGFCANPRLDIDNNLSEGTGLPENINVDRPQNGEAFRIMVQNFSGQKARPLVNVYCGGRLSGTYGAAPDAVPNFENFLSPFTVGAMWRVADVIVRVDEEGVTTGCEVRQVHPPGQDGGFDVTQDNPRF